MEWRFLAESALKCLKSKSPVNPQKWEIILKLTAHKMRDNLIILWAEEFYQKKEKIVAQHSAEKINEEIASLYENNRKTWEKYMNPPWKCFSTALSEAFQIDLSKYFEKAYAQNKN